MTHLNSFTLPNEYIDRCRECLGRSSLFLNYENLIARVFVREELKPHTQHIRNVQPPIHQINECVSYFIKLVHREGQKPVIAIFLEEVAKDFAVGTVEREELIKLAEEINKYSEVAGKAGAESAKKSFEQNQRAAESARENIERKQDSFDANAWLQTENFDEMSFRIALVVFERGYFSIFQEAYSDLSARVAKSLTPVKNTDTDNSTTAIPTTPPSATHFFGMGKRLENANAFTDETYDEERGKSFRIVKLKGEIPLFQIIKFIWCDAGSAWRKLFVEWLTDWAKAAPALIREQLAFVAGVILIEDFGDACIHILLPWANKDEASYRALLSQTFAIAMIRPEHRNEINNLLSEWSASGRRELRWAATRSYIYVGQYFPEAAMKAWKRVMAHEPYLIEIELTDELKVSLPNPFIASLIDAVSAFFFGILTSEERSSQISKAMGVLHDWVMEEKGDAISIHIFHAICFLPLIDATAVSTYSVPVLLHMLSEKRIAGNFQNNLSEMLYHTLYMSDTNDDTMEVLKEWVAQVDFDPWYLPTLTAFLAEMLEDPKHQLIKKQLKSRLTHFWIREYPISKEIIETLG